MQAEEEFRSRLREDLAGRAQPPVGTLAADALGAGRRIRRRQRTLRTVGGAAAVAAVAVGSVTLSGAFGSDTGSSAVGPGSVPGTGVTSSRPAGPPPSSHPSSAPSSASTEAPDPGIPASWTVPAAAKVLDPEWVTPRAIVAEAQQHLPQGTTASKLAGDYAWAGGDPREMWAVTGTLTATTPKGAAVLQVTLHKYNGMPTAGGCSNEHCTTKVLNDGSLVELQHQWGEDHKGAFVFLTRPDGMSVQATTRDASKISDDELFALASDSAFGSLKMEKSFVQHAESTVKGDFMNPPST